MIIAENITAETEDDKAVRFAIKYYEREMPDADMAQIEAAARLFLAELDDTQVSCLFLDSI